MRKIVVLLLFFIIASVSATELANIQFSKELSEACYHHNDNLGNILNYYRGLIINKM